MILFDVENGNPNGDPDAGNLPRIDPESGYGLVTDVCLKRKIRNYVQTVKEDEKGYQIYIKEGIPLNRSDNLAYEYLGVDEKSVKEAKKTDPDIDVKIRDFMCRNFYDIRTFGAVMVTFVKAALNCGQVRGPVQLGFARSIDPIISQEVTITRVAITTEKDAEEKKTEMGRKNIVPYALYRAEGYVSAKGKMAVRELIIFKHSRELGDCPAYKLFDAVKVSRKPDVAYPRRYNDYTVEICREEIPQTVEVTRRI